MILVSLISLIFVGQLCSGAIYYNIALKKPVTYSGIDANSKKNWANDGVRSDTKCFKTNKGDNKFWEVNLLAVSEIRGVEIKSNNNPAELTLIIGKGAEEVKRSIENADCSNGCVVSVQQMADRIRIVKSGDGALHLCEVEAISPIEDVAATHPAVTTHVAHAVGSSKNASMLKVQSLIVVLLSMMLITMKVV